MTDAKVLLTGASGSMGREAFLELRRRKNRYDVKLLLRPSRKNKRDFARFEGEPGLEIVWGDLQRPADVQRAVDGVDVVLHTAALISPAANRNRELAWQTNVGGVENLLAAIRRQPDCGGRVRLVYIGSVAQYGDRLPPIERIKVGDPLKPSVHDYYALSKCAAESLVIESGLRYWVSIRQTYIAIPDSLSLLDPVLFHQPIDQRIELITSADAGYGLVQCLETPDDFWRRVYNMSGGPNCRVVFLDYIERMLAIFGIRDYRRVFERNWFALKNFHCGYFEDSHVLNQYLGHFRQTLEDHYTQVERATPAWVKWGARLCPDVLIKAYARTLAEPLRWIESGDEEYVDAFFGSREAWERIPDWD